MVISKRTSTVVMVAITVVVILIVAWALASMRDDHEKEESKPSSNGSWGNLAEPQIEVVGTQINAITNELTIFMVVNGGKYSAHITLPVDKET